MWIPKSVEEIERAVSEGSLEETPVFEAKSQLPIKKKNEDIAIDVAAMSTNGGVLLYGLKEDQYDALTIKTPVELKGAEERIDQVIRTRLDEAPHYTILSFPTSADPSVGYIAIVVPPSERAPHAVFVGKAKEPRYYERGAKGNVQISPNRMAELYARRRRNEVDRAALLNQVISSAPFPASDDLVYMHAFVRPTMGYDGMMEKAANRFDGDVTGLGYALLQGRYYGGEIAYLQNISQTMGGLLLSANKSGSKDSLTADLALDVRVDFRGELRFFWGKAGSLSPYNQKFVLVDQIARSTAGLFLLAGKFFQHAGYYSNLDVGVSLTGLQGSQPTNRRGTFFRDSTLTDSTYVNTFQMSALNLTEKVQQATHLALDRFYNAVSQFGYNPIDDLFMKHGQ